MMISNSTQCLASCQVPLSETIRRRIAETISRWLMRHRTRRELAELNARELRDIGVTRGQAMRESHKPFWQ